MSPRLPAIGRWIEWTRNGRDFKCEILGYDTVEGYETHCLKTDTVLTPEDAESYEQMYKIFPPTAHVRYTDGTEDNFEEEDLKHYDWSYCDGPAQDY